MQRSQEITAAIDTGMALSGGFGELDDSQLIALGRGDPDASSH